MDHELCVRHYGKYEYITDSCLPQEHSHTYGEQTITAMTVQANYNKGFEIKIQCATKAEYRGT